MRIEHSKSSWAIISAQPNSNVLTESLKHQLVEDSYRGYMLDSIYESRLIKDDSFMIINHKSEDEFRFDLIKYLNSDLKVEHILVKYKSEYVTYKLFRSGYEEVFGKFHWGLAESLSSFVVKGKPFTFIPVEDYKMSYMDYRRALLNT